jgi:hypothetical protein
VDPGGGQGLLHRGQHGGELLDVVGLLGEFGRDHDLVLGDHRLGVVALHGAASGAQEAAVGVGDVRGRLRVGRLVLAPRLDVRPRRLATGMGRGGQRGGALLVAVLPLGGLRVQAGLGLAQPGQAPTAVGELGRELVAAGGAVLLVLPLVGLGGLAQDLGDFLLKLGQGAVGLAGGVAGHLGPVQRHQAQPDQPRFGAQLQRGHEEAGQGPLVADAEPGDRHVVGELVAGQHPERDVLSAAPLDLPRGAHPGRVGVQQHAEQGPGVVGRSAVPVGPVGGKERSQVELVDYVKDEPGEVVGGQPVAQVRGQEERLVAAAGQEAVGHGACYCFARSFQTRTVA